MEGKLKEEIFSKEECQTILENTFITKDVKYLSQTVKSLSGDVEGYLSEHISLELKYKENDERKTKKYFVKRNLQEEGFLAEFAKYLRVFHIESFFYNKLIKEFENLKNFTVFAPRYYYMKQNMLVLDDLCEEGFKTSDRLKCYNINQCKTAIKTVSYLHAYGLIYEEIKSNETNSKYRLNEAYPDEFEEKFYNHCKETPSMKFFTATIRSLIDLVDLVPEECCPDKVVFKKLLKEHDAVDDEKVLQENYRCTCVHGDLWANNIMFKYDKEGTGITDCRVLDFQFMRYYLPSFDIMLFLYGNTTLEFRKENSNYLLRYYYDCLSSVLQQYNIELTDLFSFETFTESSVLVAPAAKIQAFSDKSLLYLPNDLYLELENHPDVYKELLIDNRSKYILDNYRKNEKFRAYADEGFTELNKILQDKKKLEKQLKLCK